MDEHEMRMHILDLIQNVELLRGQVAHAQTVNAEQAQSIAMLEGRQYPVVPDVGRYDVEMLVKRIRRWFGLLILALTNTDEYGSPNSPSQALMTLKLDLDTAGYCWNQTVSDIDVEPLMEQIMRTLGALGQTLHADGKRRLQLAWDFPPPPLPPATMVLAPGEGRAIQLDAGERGGPE